MRVRCTHLGTTLDTSATIASAQAVVRATVRAIVQTIVPAAARAVVPAVVPAMAVAAGLSVEPLAVPERVIDLGGESIETMVAGGVYNDQLGNDIDVGDVNGDGVGDLVMGAHWSGGAGRNIVGRTYVLYGRQQWAPGYDLANRGAADWSVRGAGRESRLGSAVAVGDVGGDPLDDLIVGSLLADPFGQVDGGAAAVLFGGQSVSGEIDLEDTAPDVLFAGDSRSSGTDQLGSDARVCDVNGDGASDIIVAAANRGDGHGAVYVWWGPVVRGTSYNLKHAPADWMLLGSHERGWFGSNIACGDIDGDSYEDLIVSVGRNSVPDAPVDGGAVHVFRGGPWAGGVVDVAPDQAYATIVGWPGAMLGMARSTIRSGRGEPLQVADATGDGHADLLIGSPLGNKRRGSLVLLSGPLPAGVTDLRVAPHLRITTSTDEARLGWSVATGQLDGSGVVDVIVAAPGAPAGAKDKAGLAYGLRGPLPTIGELLVTDTVALLVLGPQPSAGNAGMSLALRDVTGDGVNDLAIGYPDAAPYGRRASGAVYLMRGPLLEAGTTASPTTTASSGTPIATHATRSTPGTPGTPYGTRTAPPTNTATTDPGTPNTPRTPPATALTGSATANATAETTPTPTRPSATASPPEAGERRLYVPLLLTGR